VTISDFVADLRAATPSNAAELAVPDQEALYQMLDSMSSAMATALKRQLTAARRHYQLLSAHPALQSPENYLIQRRKSLEMLTNRLASAQLQLISGRKQRYIAMTAKLDAMSPLKVLTRGYAMVQGGEGEVLRSVDQVQPGDKIKISVSDGEIEAAVTNVKENSHE
jgi:exodeoxyribonuclease VII large subunit